MTNRPLRTLAVLAALAGATLVAPRADAIVGGSSVADGERTFMAAILDRGSQFCGGSVVAARKVITAAHCVPDGNASGLSVSVGSTDWTQGTEIPVVRVDVHPDYEDDSTADIAVLTLAADAPVAPIALADADDDALEADGAPVVVAGWGSQVPVIGQVPPLDTQLRDVDLAVVGDADCGSSNAANQVCAAAFLKDSCQGDSGGPLFAETSGGAVQIGVVSSGFGCAVPMFPGYYTEVNAASIAGFVAAQLTR